MTGASLELAAPIAPVAVDAMQHARLRQIVRDHVDFVWRSLKNLGVPDGDVDDALQQVFLVVSRKLDHVVPGREKTFLFGTAFRIAHRARRTLQRRREVPLADWTVEPDHGAMPDELVERSRARAILDAALQQMDLDARAVFVLFEIEQLTKNEVAAALEIPPGTVASRLRRAREQFSAYLRKIESTPARGRP